jgi:predicted transcriptional regulator
MTSKWLFQSKRSSIQIIGEILNISRVHPATKSDIIEQAKINYRQINDYLDWLVREGLIEPIGNQPHLFRFRPTHKGLQLLSTLENIKALLN